MRFQGEPNDNGGHLYHVTLVMELTAPDATAYVSLFSGGVIDYLQLVAPVTNCDAIWNLSGNVVADSAAAEVP